MGGSVRTLLLILFTTAISCSILVADNTILDGIIVPNESSIIHINNSNNDTLDQIKNDTTSTTAYEMSNNTSDDVGLSTIDSVATTSNGSVDSIITTIRDTTPSGDGSNATSSESQNSISRSNEETEEVDLPEQSIEDIDGLEIENIVHTTHGEVKGLPWRGIQGIVAYIDIPYGQFHGYFKAPIPPEAWDTVHYETEHKKRCPQIVEDTYVGDLDCLTLSVFTPRNAVNASVLFYIHESHFSSGSGDPAKYGPEYLVSRGIILVIPNYRLGPLGFLCLRNETAPGNAALKDLNLALEWTRKNIKAFGGDPYDITLSGDGTAGALVGYLALSSKSSNYISKVITESGSVLSYWALDRTPEVTADTLAQKIREQADISYCNTYTEAEIKIIVSTAKDVDLKPCIENGEDAFMAHTPWEKLHLTHMNKTFMIGAANLAGAREAFFKTEDSIAHLNEDFSEFLPNDLHFKNNEERNEIGKRVKAFYFEENDIRLEHVRELAICFTDASYLGPGIRAARRLVREGSTVYLYEFSFVGELNRELLTINETLDGAVKGDIVGYLFTQDGYIPPEESEERRVVNLMADLWASFVRTGIPSAEGIEWDPMSLSEDSEEVYLSIASSHEQKHGIHVNRIRLWTEIYNEHFIEHNSSFTHKASVLASLVTLMLSLGLCKNAIHL